jgi:hypothetical protein
VLFLLLSEKLSMTTFTIDIPDSNTEEVIAQLKKLGVKIRQSSLVKLDKLTKADYEKHFSHRSAMTKNKVLKYL